jgi:hypothetical protein
VLAQSRRVRDGQSNKTFDATKSTGGVGRRFRDVTVLRDGNSDWIAISSEAAVAGDTLFLDIDEGGRPQQLMLCVIESQPFMFDGATRHRIRLQATDLPPVLFEQQVRRG